jgi:hypothetical protein
MVGHRQAENAVRLKSDDIVPGLIGAEKSLMALESAGGKMSLRITLTV